MFLYILIFIIGAFVGSFLNVVILRLNSGEKIMISRSHCPKCKEILSAKDLMPFISFILLGGKCRYCKAKISWQYFIVETVCGLVFVLVTYNILGGLDPMYLWMNSDTAILWFRNIIFSCFLIVLFVYDLKWYQILDQVTVPAMIVALMFNLWLGISWQHLFLAAAIGLGLFLFQFVVSKGKWIGDGDLRFGIMMGLMLSWPNILVGLMLAYVIGSLVAVPLVMSGKKGMKSQIPFGTFLSVGTFIALLWGEQIINWYMEFL